MASPPCSLYKLAASWKTGLILCHCLRRVARVVSWGGESVPSRGGARVYMRALSKFANFSANFSPFPSPLSRAIVRCVTLSVCEVESVVREALSWAESVVIEFESVVRTEESESVAGAAIQEFVRFARRRSAEAISQRQSRYVYVHHLLCVCFYGVPERR